ncbi:polysaccharide biosynthesis/export family protein [Collimonas silvisoli]|uniref:polysaccharide biosynthesis/export family protein n=1 Tax=Collimonas silvisoli TaxID=2825884 RepID=UPI001B8C43CC|nr:polysaccharide biosynthesis/export family protein [Collimonas silvisoli]
MLFFSRIHLLKMVILAGLIPAIAACAVAPGMHMDNLRAAGETESGAMAANLKQITPELLQSEKTMREQQSSQDISGLLADPEPYRIGSGDVLSIQVWAHPELSTPAMSGQAAISQPGADSGNIPGFVVDHSGLVQFPFVGPVKLAGLTALQARGLLTDKLARYVKAPDLTLRVQAYRSKHVYLNGEVRAPGIGVINDIPMTLPEAMDRAGGILPSGDQSQISIYRAGVTYQISLPLLIKKGINPSKILLESGDIVHVLSREESKVFVLGEVTRPSTLTLRNGRLTLNEALGEAGGLNPLTSNGRQVYVVRNAGNAGNMKPVVYHLDARSPTAFALAENFELSARDVVYVDAAPLATWSRVISLILPSAQSVTSAVQAGK